MKSDGLDLNFSKLIYRKTFSYIFMKDKIISLMKLRGPVLPLDVSKSLNTNSIMAGAYLSELVSLKLIKISSLKIGGSPLYYLPEHSFKLQNFTHVLKGPEKKSYDLLQEKKILKDDELDSVTRVSLQNIKDFAKPIEITFNDVKEKYWKWYLISNDELQNLLKIKFENNQLNKQNENNTEKNDVEQINLNNQNNQINQPIENNQSTSNSSNPKPNPNANIDTSDNEDEIIENHEDHEIKNDSNIDQKSADNDIINDNFKDIKKDNDGTLKGHQGQVILEDKIEEKDIKTEDEISSNESKNKLSEDDFLNSILNLFSEKNIEILSKEIIKNNSEIEFKILLPSPLGKILYFVVAKNKKRCSDADLAQAYVKAEMNKLPVLFLHSGDLTKKAISMLKNEFKIITTYKLN